MQIGVVDYEAGNLKSVETALHSLEKDYDFSSVVSDNPETLLKADKLIFPGVGEARAAMRVLVKRGLDQVIRDFIATGKPVLGICIGCQIVLSRSEESDTECLGIVDGTSLLFPTEPGLKVPHMGWNQVFHDERHPLFEGIPSGASFYFVHSYYPAPVDSSVEISWSEYGIRFTSGLQKDNLTAFQFHPEKSGRYGLKMLANFIKHG